MPEHFRISFDGRLHVEMYCSRKDAEIWLATAIKAVQEGKVVLQERSESWAPVKDTHGMHDAPVAM